MSDESDPRNDAELSGRYCAECGEWLDLVEWTFHSHNPARTRTKIEREEPEETPRPSLAKRLAALFFRRRDGAP